VKGEENGLIGTILDITERKQAESVLKTSEEKYRALIETTNTGYLIVDRQAKVLDANSEYVRLTGYNDLREILGRSVLEWTAQYEIERHDKAIAQCAIDGFIRNLVIDYVDRNGRTTPIEINATVIGEGAQAQILSLCRDITERKVSQANLQLAANVFSHAREGIIITDASGTIIDVNESFARITGFGREEALGQNPRILKSDRQDPAFYELLWHDLTEQGHWSGEIWNRHRDGEVYAELLTISSVRDASGAVQQYVGLFSDISAMKEHQIQLEHIAHFDALTHLPNRVLLADRLQQAMAQSQRRGQQLAVAFLDLDGFKTINDQHGHDAGDQVLIKLAQRMKQALREGDSLARLGGDEFVAVLIDLEDLAASRPLLSRLLEACSQPVRVGDLSLQVSASLGVTFYPQPQDIDADQLLRQADQAMYQAKLSGKNRFHFFDAEQDSSIRGHHESVERIRLALDNQEFVLHYQPKVNMGSGQIIGAEALIRWQHPEKGLLAPAIFLPVIEDHPLAVSIGEWVIDTALTQMQAWQAAGLDFGVSVNIGARQLQQSDFVDRLKFILAKHPQVNPASLELEVLETSALEDIAQVSQVIEDCAQIGVTCALDDFGTGYSSLTYLKRLRVAMLKIDQSFVRDMLEDPDDLAILQGIIGLAASFKRHVIAEGVETVAHGSLLMQLGCELGQGYGIARPMPAAQMPQWATEWQPDVVWSELPWLGGVPESMEEQSVF
jgi:diguanylate cyclase (GGDEF)-like protein/PAS domain S-box-containing protein